MGAPDMIVNGTAAGGPPIGGTGTTNTIPRWTGPSTLGDSGLIDDGSAVYTTARNAAFGSTSSAGYRARVLAAAGAGSAFGLRIDAGTNSTDYALRIANQATTSDYLAVRGDGNVGIGWASPTAKLHVTQGSSPNFANLLIGSAGTSTNFYDANEHYFRNGSLATGMYISSLGNVGIGTASPLAKLHTLISGTAVVSAGSDPAPGTLFEGTNTALTTGATSTQQLAIMSNSAVAADAGGGLVLGGKYTGNAYANFAAIKSGKDNATGAEYGGYLAFYTRTNGQAGVGERARIDSAGRMCIGTTTATTGRALTTVADLDVFGVRVGRGGDASQTSSVAVGTFALSAASTGAQNTAVGYSALSLATGGNNTAIGSNTLSQAFSGNNNTAIGVAAILPASSTASGNTAVGMEALRSHTSGNSNTALGWRAGYGAASANANTTGSDNIYVGRETVGTANNNTNEIVIGAGATGNGSNTATLGNSSTVSIHLDAKFVRLVDSYTVGTLPAAGTAGRIARVTDGDAGLAWGATVVNTGAGATPYLVWDNGTNWTVFGK